MATAIVLPAMGESITEAVLLEWLKHDGDSVQAEEMLCVLETDKANVELPAPATGILRIVVPQGQTIQVGETIARLETVEAAPAAPRPPASPAPVSSPAIAATAHAPLEDYSPAVRRLLTEHTLDPATITATGPHGRLLKEDILQALATPSPRPEAEAFASTPAAAGKPVASTSARQEASLETTTPVFENGIRRVPMSRIRRRIADNLVQAQHTTAMLTTFNEIDMSAVIALRARYGEPFRATYGVSLGLLSFFARACTLALRAFPAVNARIDGEDIVYHDYIHLGVAVSTERGLVVPVLRHLEQLTSLAPIEAAIKRLAAAAREGTLGLADISGGTFTITNGGVFGSLLSTPILHHPQSGILGLHAIQKRPVVVQERIEVRSMMYVALSYDHRLIDGREAVSFLVRVKELVEDPTRVLLEI